MAEAILEQSDSLIDRVKEAVLPLDREVKVVKKDGTTEDYCIEKIVVAVNKSAKRVLVNLTAENFVEICNFVTSKINEMGTGSITMTEIHSIVECALQQIDPQVALSYRNYRNYKQDFVGMLDKVYQESQRIMYLGDKENSNIDSTLVATKRSLTYNELSKELYKKFFLNKAELQACNDGYIYVHDMSARLNTMNCFSADTRFITNQGMKSFNDFKDGDSVIVPTHDGSWQKAVVKCFGKQKLNKIVFKRGGKGEKTVRCTSNHRWLLKDGTETTNLKVGDKLILTPDMASFDWDTLTPEQKKLWVYGFCMADGFTTQNSENSWYSTIRLFGRKIEYAELFEDAGFTVTQPNCLDGALSVYIPRFRKETFEPSQISYEDMVYFVNGWLSADGNRSLGMNNSSPYRGIQVTGSANDYIYDMLNMAGYFVTTVRDYTGQETNYGVRTQETKHYGFYSNQGCRGWVVQSIEPDQEEDVWCLVVENNHSFILENGIVTGNCCLFDIAEVLNGGFEMGNIWYNEPQSLDVAFDVIGDIVMSASSQQYGGFTLPEIDTVLVKYAEKSYNMYYEEAIDLMSGDEMNDIDKLAHEYAMKKVQKDFEQGFQGWEYKFNTVGSSRGDYPFITVTSGLETNKFGIMCNKAMYKVRMNGQGKKGNKKPVLFPKIVFLYDKELHGEGGVLREVYDAGIACSQRAMYPDWLSMSGEGYIASMYKKYKKVISPMGSVDGKEVITYKDKDNVITSTFEEFWDKYSAIYDIRKQKEAPKADVYVQPNNISILDNGKWVEVLFITKNYCAQWDVITLENGYKLTCTHDHPLQTERGRVLVQDLQETDKVYCLIDGVKTAVGIDNITSIEKEDKVGYDVTTMSDKFDVSNFCSHNCRAFLSPWYERGGMEPADKNDVPVFTGRFNIGAVSLHLPMIYMKAKEEGKDFYTVLDYYLEMIRGLHLRTYEYLGEMKASINPLAFCEGGFYGGHLGYNEKIKPALESATASFGITALNELQRLYNGKSIFQDGQFAIEVMEHINEKVAEYKKLDGKVYAIYGTPAESLAEKQVYQFRNKYGIIKDVSDRLYVSNSFHCHVTEDITPIQKQDSEKRFWEMLNGGKIQYVRYPISYNTEAVQTLVERAMDLGFYEGVNLELSYCDDCGHEELNMDICPKCGSRNLTKISRMNGYLSYSRIKGDTRLNKGKMAEIAERKSM